MGKIILVALVIVLSGCDKGNPFNSYTVKAGATYRLASPGRDLVVFEFTPETQPNMQCVLVSGSLECFHKKTMVKDHGNTHQKWRERLSPMMK